MLDSVQITLDTARKPIQGLDKKLKKIKPGGWLLVIIIFALFLRLYFFVGLNWSSDVNYAKFAHDVLNGHFYVGNVVDALRPASFYPIAFFYFLFGINEFSLVSYHLLTSIGSIVIIFYLGKYFFDEKTALLAALFLSFFPLNVIYATWALPDVPISFLSGLVILIFFKAKDKIKIPSFGIDLRKILFLLCGILIGFGYLHKVSGAIILLFLTVYIFYIIIKNRKVDFDYFYVFLGFLLIIFFEGFFYLINNGDFFTRYNVVTSYHHLGQVCINSNYLFYPAVMFNIPPPADFSWDIVDVYDGVYGFFYYFIMLSFFYILLKKNKNVLFLLAWFWILFLYLEFGTMQITEYVPIHKLARYLTVLTIPALLCLSYAVIEFSKIKRSQKTRKILVIIAIIFLFATSIYYTSKNLDHIHANTKDLREIYKFTKKYPEQKVYCSYYAVCYLEFYYKYEDNEPVRTYDSTIDPEQLEGSFVVLNSTFYEIKNPICFPSKDWVLFKVITGPEIGILGTYDPEIYYVPKSNVNP